MLEHVGVNGMKKLLVLVLSILFSNHLNAQSMDRGLDAAQSGDYATAYKEWEYLAKKGNPFAQEGLGWLYSSGDGVARDDILAHMWFNIASINGNKKADQYREQVEFDMWPDEISMAKAIAMKCIKSDYMNCGY